MLGFANIYSIYLSVYQLLICYFLLKTQDVIITKFDEEPFLLPDYTNVVSMKLFLIPGCPGCLSLPDFLPPRITAIG